MPGPKCVVAAYPVQFTLALPVDKTAVVYDCRRAGGGLRGRHRLRLGGRGALPVLISPVAVAPFLLALALTINLAAVVNWLTRRR
ncbi:MAG: hypothetical protein OXN94_01530 [Chloroflexota bacterium]|nr:hypothetical protein [Chloroflexota bacterium]